MKERLNPNTPSPFLTSPSPVSQAERTTSLVPQRFSPDASIAVKIPSSGPDFLRLAPAKASPERNSGLSRFGRLTEVDRVGFSFLDGPESSRKKPCVAM